MHTCTYATGNAAEEEVTIPSHEFRTDTAKQVLTDSRTRATYLNKFGQDAIHRFVVKQQQDSLVKCFQDYSRPGFIYTTHSEEAYHANVSEMEVSAIMVRLCCAVAMIWH